ncbi:hypothetical protein [Microbulbifer hainanensis]|uniref:hypothetical protein n=1 Tax=Microbulbifer hainanensis TaxID=2735675 RepID=UPI001866D337|nr:hypothetical protein [Microbulbifer hainanensis]
MATDVLLCALFARSLRSYFRAKGTQSKPRLRTALCFRTMKFTFIAISIYLVSGFAYACSCVELTDIEKISSASKIFAGKTIKSEINDQYEVENLIKVVKVYKGNVGKEEIIRSSGISASCGVEEYVGFSYLIFTNEQGEASICSGHEEYDPLHLEFSGEDSPGRLFRALNKKKHKKRL